MLAPAHHANPLDTVNTVNAVDDVGTASEIEVTRPATASAPGRAVPTVCRTNTVEPLDPIEWHTRDPRREREAVLELVE